jgi:hypothetical protein
LQVKRFQNSQGFIQLRPNGQRGCCHRAFLRKLREQHQGELSLRTLQPPQKVLCRHMHASNLMKRPTKPLKWSCSRALLQQQQGARNPPAQRMQPQETVVLAE